ncbi:MAG: ribonuclease III domain-containing protein [Oscillospiraceae bacterium]
MDKPGQLSPSTLAFVGDGIYGLLVRTRLAEVNRPSRELHSLSVKLVNANAQARAYELISPMLTETEQTMFKRGRNFGTGGVPKNSTSAQYHAATGIETLFGFLYLSNEYNRMKELFSVIWNDFSGNN